MQHIRTDYGFRRAGTSSWNARRRGSSIGSGYLSVAPSRDKSIIKNAMSTSLANKAYQKLYEKSKAKSFLNKKGASSLILDAFNQWHCKSKDYKITPDKYWWHHLLSQVDNHLLQFATNGNAGYSYLAAQHTMGIIDKLYKKYKDDLDKHLSDLNNDIQNGTSTADSKFTKDLERSVNAAKNKIKKDIDDMSKNGKQAGKSSDPNDLDRIDLLNDPRLKRLASISKSDIKNFLKSSIDRATQSVTGKSFIEEESIFDSDDIEDLVNIENFAHVAMLPDLTNRIKKYSVSFDIYIDDSGSMDNHIRLDGAQVTYRNLARLLAFQLEEMDLLRDCMLFACSDSLTKIDKKDIFSAHIGGGTDIAQCITNAKAVNRPCILITDGYDQIDMENDYYKDCFILVLDQTTMPKCFKRFAEGKQIVFYGNDGKFRQGVYQETDSGWSSHAVVAV